MAVNFNPLFPYGKRRCCPQNRGRTCHFNPLFPYGKRPPGRRRPAWPSDFNPLFPYGKRRFRIIKTKLLHIISIHSSHTGRDAGVGCGGQRPPHFNPLFPYGKRLQAVECAGHIADFNPLFPYGKRPRGFLLCVYAPAFQSTLPIREET